MQEDKDAELTKLLALVVALLLTALRWGADKRDAEWISLKRLLGFGAAAFEHPASRQMASQKKAHDERTELSLISYLQNGPLTSYPGFEAG